MSITYAPVIGELCPKPRSGHIAIFCHGQMIIYGGICEEYGYSYHPPSELWSYSTDTCSWTFLTTKGKAPSQGLSGSCGAFLNDHLVIFGGFEEDLGSTSTVHILDLRALTWLNLDGKIFGFPPSRRDKLCCWVYDSKVFYFGGYGHFAGTERSENGDFVQEVHPDGSRQGLGWNSHVYVLDCSNLESLQWSQCKLKGDIPCPRAAHASARIGPTGYMFGGRFQHKRRSDLYSFHLRDFKWTKIKATCGPLPVGRSWHILEALNEKHLLLFGGLSSDGDPLDDFWIFKTDSRMWTPLSSKYTNNLPRIWHSSTRTDEDGEVLIFGGCTNSLLLEERLNHSNEVLSVRVSPVTLRRLCLDYVMCNISVYKDAVAGLPKTLRRLVEMRLHALQFCMASDSYSSCNHTSACNLS